MTATATGDAAVAPAAAAGASRWLSLDALRGLTIAAMILVNNPGSWSHVYAPLDHADWHGCTPTDLIFPAFLFVAGVAIVPSLGRAALHAPPQELRRRVLRRAAVLVLLGLFIQAFPLVTFAAERQLFAPLLEVRIPGVLQRIGVCYGAAALLFLYTTPATQRRVLWLCLLLYWPLLALCPTPDGGWPDLDSKGDHLAGWLDRTVFGSHTWRGGPYDPEGLLSTIPAVGTALLGVAAGRVLTADADPAARIGSLLLRGALLMAAGAVWGWFFPINKALWTSSYVLWTGGVATTGLGLCVWAFEYQPWARLARPLQVYGVNALLVFVGSALLARIVGRLWTVDAAGTSAKAWFHEHLLASWAPPHLASLLHAVLWVAGWYAVLALLWRRGIVWKV